MTAVSAKFAELVDYLVGRGGAVYLPPNPLVDKYLAVLSSGRLIIRFCILLFSTELANRGMAQEQSEGADFEISGRGGAVQLESFTLRLGLLFHFLPSPYGTCGRQGCLAKRTGTRHLDMHVCEVLTGDLGTVMSGSESETPAN
ncbi:hypothetical protein TBK1r_29660 [Stieleria magnilauensis]|uniref:Uncharacterized protein n=1 Tax=Stieleria magnilauensis TaxID=2527963 RepID=A0ABX5XPU3_9BACT|nr:hypothetical protein TBK1r_29660 [Planctomycetes bacterium TBK1r]